MRFLLLASALIGLTTQAYAQPVDARNPVFPGPAGVVVGAPTGGNLGTGSVNATGLYVNGQAVAGGLAVPSSNLIGGNGTQLTPVTLGSGLTFSNGTLSSTGGGGTPGGTTGQIQFNNAGTFGGLATTGTGNVVLSTSPTLVSPALGTPTSLNLANSVGLSLATGVSGNLPVTNLASGSGASASTFWRGDGTWASASGGCTSNCTFSGTTTLPSVAISGGSISGATGVFTTLGATGPINTTSALGFQIGAQNAISFSSPSTGHEKAIFIGPFTGASAPTTAQIIVGVGPNVLESASGLTQESTAVGSGTAVMFTTGGGLTAMGTSACASQLTSSCTAYGSDAMRDAWDAGGSIAIGGGAYGDGGNGTNNPTIAIGTNAMWGSASTITMASGYTVGDVLTFAVTSANTCNGTSITINCTTNLPSPLNYTVVSGDSSASVLAGHVAASLNGTSTSYVLGDGQLMSTQTLISMFFSVADATNHPAVIKGHYPASWQISLAYSCAGTCGGSATVVNAPFTGGNNLLIGQGVFGYFGATTATANTVVGMGAASSFATTASQNSIFGFNAAQLISTASFNSGFGHLNFSALTTGSRNAVFGSYSGFGITTGSGNHIFSDETIAGQGCITTGSENLEVGGGACVQSPTASNQMSIQNAIYGVSNSATGSGISTGCIFFYGKACTPGTVESAVAFIADTNLRIGTVATVLAAGELGFQKIAASGSAPGAGTVKISVVAGTNANTCKLIAYAGTSTTPVTIVDNIGGGC